MKQSNILNNGIKSNIRNTMINEFKMKNYEDIFVKEKVVKKPIGTKVIG